MILRFDIINTKPEFQRGRTPQGYKLKVLKSRLQAVYASGRFGLFVFFKYGLGFRVAILGFRTWGLAASRVVCLDFSRVRGYRVLGLRFWG